MTADLDLSPEAVERLAKRHALHVSSKYPTAATLRALSAENARLRAERDAAWQAGAEAMREATAQTCVLSGPDLAGGDWGPEGRDMAVMLERRIRALPLPGQPTNNEENT